MDASPRSSSAETPLARARSCQVRLDLRECGERLAQLEHMAWIAPACRCAWTSSSVGPWPSGDLVHLVESSTRAASGPSMPKRDTARVMRMRRAKARDRLAVDVRLHRRARSVELGQGARQGGLRSPVAAGGVLRSDPGRGGSGRCRVVVEPAPLRSRSPE